MQYATALIILEMLCVNLYVSHICLDRKASPAIVVPVMAGFSMLVWRVSAATIAVLPGYGDGYFIFLGFFYLLPLYLLYRCGIKTTVSVMCLSWSYTMLAFLFSRYLSQFFPEAAQATAMLITQTAVYLLTLRAFLRLLHERLLYVIVHTQPDKGNMFFCLSLSTCAVTFCANFVLLKENFLAAKLALICTLAVNTTIMYQALYGLTQARRHAVQTRQESLTDALTGLNNRRAFFEQAELLMDGGRPFAIVFIDLDRFKSINDTYGHVAGDWYLKHFAQAFTQQFSHQGTLYRIAGDEFVFLREGEQGANAMLEEIHGFSVPLADSEIPFLGFSCGAASFPADAEALDALLAAADKRMYRAKTDVHAANNTV